MDKTVILQLKNITKKFGAKVIANNNVSLDVYKGEILSILGENGCGKTTLFNALTGANQRVGNFPGVTVEGRVTGKIDEGLLVLIGITVGTIYFIDAINKAPEINIKQVNYKKFANRIYYNKLLPLSARERVISSAYSRSLPTGIP